MNLFRSEELSFSTSLSSLYEILAVKSGRGGASDRKSLRRCHSGTSLCSQLLGQTVIRLRHVQIAHSIYVNGYMTVSLAWPWKRMCWWHRVTNGCVCSKWKIVCFWKEFILFPLTQTLLWLFTLIWDTCQMLTSVLYELYFLFSWTMFSYMLLILN